MEKSSISYSKMLNYNLKLIPNIGNVMPYQDMLEILFGNVINDIPRLELINKKFVVDIDDGTFYFVLSKFEEYLLFAKKRINWKKENVCPINYFDCLNKLEISFEIEEENLKLIKVLSEFKQFIVEKNDMHSNMILNLYWNEIFKGVISSYNKTPYLMTLKFRKEKGFPLILNIVEGDITANNAISIDMEEKKDQFDKVYQSWKNTLKMEEPSDFVINCLTEVTGSFDIANFIFRSHEDKKQFVIKIIDLNEIINFKSDKKRCEYLELFKSIYPNLFEKKAGNLFLNFEGFNKYLLNLEIDYLNTFEDKERINTLYYNVMDELVNSYKKLYIFFKTI